MNWNFEQSGSAAVSRARHRAPEPTPERDDVDELADTVAISPLCLTYGQHAATEAGLAELWPATGLCAVPVAQDAVAAGTDADGGAAGGREGTGRIARVFGGRLRPWQRSA